MGLDSPGPDAYSRVLYYYVTSTIAAIIDWIVQRGHRLLNGSVIIDVQQSLHVSFINFQHVKHNEHLGRGYIEIY